MSQQQPQRGSLAGGPGGDREEKPADYVYFERTTANFSKDTLAKATAAKLKLGNYYKVAVESAIERNTRCVLCYS